MIDIITSIFENHYFQTWLGSVCGHVLSLYSDEFKGSKPFLEKMFPNQSDTFYFRLDFLILPLIGSLLACVLLEPSNIKTCIFSGLSWSGTIIALLKRNTNNLNSSNNEQ